MDLNATMKYLPLILTALIMSVLSTSDLKAQTTVSEENNYVILTRKIAQLQPILLAAQELKKEDGDMFGQYHVIICGQEIGGITEPDKVDKFIAMSKKAGVQLVACGFSLNKFDVDRDLVPKDIIIVENGLLYNLQLQKKGYYSLGL